MANDFPVQIRLKAVDQVSGVLTRLTQKFPRLTENVKQANNAFYLMQKNTEGLRKSLSHIGNKMSAVGRTASLVLTAPITAFGVMTIKAAADFELAMNRVGALTGATGEEFVLLQKTARQLGATTMFSASEAADAMSNLGTAGFTTSEILKSAGSVLNLATASQLDMATSAEALGGTLRAYGFEASQAEMVTDRLVQAFIKSNIKDPVEFIEAFKLAGPVAKSAGLQFEEVATALGLLSNTMFKGSLGGTALKAAISRLIKPSSEAKKALASLKIHKSDLFDSAGRLKSLSTVIRVLGPHAEKTSELLQIFGERAGPAMAALLGQGISQFEDLNDQILNSQGQAQKIADVMSKGAVGAMKEFESAVQELQLVIASSGVLEFFTETTKQITVFVQRMAQTNPTLLKFGVVMAVIVAAVGPLLVVFGSFLAMLPSIMTGISLLRAAFMSLNLTMLANPVGLIISGIAALIASAYLLVKHWDKVKVFFVKLWESPAGKVLIFLMGPIAQLITAASLIQTHWKEIKTFFVELWNNPISKLFLFITGPIGQLILLAGSIMEHWGSTGDFFADLWDGIKQTFSDGLEFIQEILGKVGKFFGFENTFNPSVQLGAPLQSKELTRTINQSRVTTNNASVAVDFSNLPQGARVTSMPGLGMLDLRLGYAGVLE